MNKLIALLTALLAILILVTIAFGYYEEHWTFDSSSEGWSYGWTHYNQSGSYSSSFGHNANGSLYVGLSGDEIDWSQGGWGVTVVSGISGSTADYAAAWIYADNLDQLGVNIVYSDLSVDVVPYDNPGNGWSIYSTYVSVTNTGKTVTDVIITCSSLGSGFCYIDDVTVIFSGGATPTPTPTHTATASATLTPHPTQTSQYMSGCNITDVTHLDGWWLSWCWDRCLWTATPSPTITPNRTFTPTPDCYMGVCRYHVDTDKGPNTGLAICPMVVASGDRPIPPEPTCQIVYETDVPFPNTHPAPTSIPYTPPVTVTPQPLTTLGPGIDCSVPTYYYPTPIVSGWELTSTLVYTETGQCITAIHPISYTLDPIILDPVEISVEGVELCVDWAYLLPIQVGGVKLPLEDLIAFLALLAAIALF